MTVTSATARVSYAGNGSQTAFPVTFRFLADNHIRAALRDVAGSETEWVLNTDFTLTGAGGAAGGTLTAATAPASGETLVILRNIPLTQDTDYVDNDELPAETLEADFDRTVMVLQQFQEQLNRVITVPSTDSASVELPTSAERAGKYLGFDAGGVPVAVNDPGDVVVTAYAETLLNAGDAATARGLLGSGATGDALFAAATAAAARAILGLGTSVGVVPVGAVQLFALMAAPTGWLECDGAAVSRTTYAALFDAVTIQQAGSRTNGSAVVTGLADTSRMAAGMPVSGGGIPVSTTIASVNSATQITLSQAATLTATSTIVVAPFGIGDGTTTFNKPDLRGEFIRGWDHGRGVDAGRRFGSSQLDAFQGHRHGMNQTINTSSTGALGTGGGGVNPLQVTDPIADGVNGTPRTAAETRPRNLALMPCIFAGA